MPETITSIASLLWPLLVLVVLMLFRRPLLQVVRSAGQREWTLEVGGQKLSMKQLSDQQNSMIADLQAQIGVLHQEIATLSAANSAAADEELAEPDTDTATPVPNSILWVDDVPENNALLVDQLQHNGVRVELARSTREGLAKLGQRRYGAILSDMGRFEDGAQIPDAGMRLLHAVRQTDPTLPFLIYCGPNASRTYHDAALAAGANVITASPAELSEQLRSLRLL